MRRKYVDKFTIDKPEEKAQYEELLNDPEVYIVKEQFAYDKTGKAVITVWWDKGDDILDIP